MILFLRRSKPSNHLARIWLLLARASAGKLDAVLRREAARKLELLVQSGCECVSRFWSAACQRLRWLQGERRIRGVCANVVVEQFRKELRRLWVSHSVRVLSEHAPAALRRLAAHVVVELEEVLVEFLASAGAFEHARSRQRSESAHRKVQHMRGEAGNMKQCAWLTR